MPQLALNFLTTIDVCNALILKLKYIAHTHSAADKVVKETEIGDIFNLLPIPVTFTSYSGGTRNFFFLTFFRPERSNEEEEISTNDVNFFPNYWAK